MTNFSYKPTLTGELVVLRPVDEGDYDALKAAMDDPDVIRFTGSRGEIGDEQARQWYRTRNDQTDRLDMAMAGFVVEGRLRDELYWDGEWVDSIVMSVLAPEWKARS
ncbi:hypothetical protein EV646_101993 [Kribbella antiqua]|uniref:Acetyltransferase (GNAT) family protein n=1 Tax=Kribbella antiqua TaxID=2512217 RepID=A0A4R2J2Q4_9ACTN|nr:GNAT family N-acetyltransferase [Kribbella antiqua]TCO51997.1 hypothetical protein EV646_101993 [Kribbella antiqua]